MAEGGEFGYDDPVLDHQIDNDDNNDPPYVSDHESVLSEEEEVDRTRPFDPTAASTPYHGREQ